MYIWQHNVCNNCQKYRTRRLATLCVTCCWVGGFGFGVLDLVDSMLSYLSYLHAFYSTSCVRMVSDTFNAIAFIFLGLCLRATFLEYIIYKLGFIKAEINTCVGVCVFVCLSVFVCNLSMTMAD